MNQSCWFWSGSEGETLYSGSLICWGSCKLSHDRLWCLYLLCLSLWFFGNLPSDLLSNLEPRLESGWLLGCFWSLRISNLSYKSSTTGFKVVIDKSVRTRHLILTFPSRIGNVPLNPTLILFLLYLLGHDKSNHAVDRIQNLTNLYRLGMLRSEVFQREMPIAFIFEVYVPKQTLFFVWF